MRVSYNRLWSLMRKNKMKKGELAAAAGLSKYTISKMSKDEPVSLEAMMHLCKVFHCNIEDVVEIIEEE